LGHHLLADELRSLDPGGNAVHYINGPRLNSLLYLGERRLPRWKLADPYANVRQQSTIIFKSNY
jgi:hypothetical protein